MREHRGDLRSFLMIGALTLSLGATSAEAASLMNGPVTSNVQPLLQLAVDHNPPRMILASASGAESGESAGGESADEKDNGKGVGNGGEAADSKGNSQDAEGSDTASERGRGDEASADRSAAADPGTARDDDAAGAGASEAAADANAAEADANTVEADAGVADAAPAADESSAAPEGASASADSTATASAGTADGIDAQAGAAASAEAVNDDAGSSVSATADADASVAVESDQPHSAKTKSMSKSVTTKFGALTIARTTTSVVLEDGTRVRASAHARALALATPGITKADSSTRASVDIRDGGAAEAAATADGATASIGGTVETWNDPAAISEANAL